MLARLIARSKSRPDVSSGRVLFVAAFIGFWVIIISARLVYLQFSQYQSPPNLDRNAQQLAKSLGLKQAELTKEFRDAAAAKKRFIWIARRLDADVANKIVELNLPGLQTQLEPKRYYPNGSLAAYVLGYVGIEGKGLGGGEQFFNAKISGEAGHLLVEKDAYGKPYESYEIAAKSVQTAVRT